MYARLMHSPTNAMLFFISIPLRYILDSFFPFLEMVLCGSGREYLDMVSATLINQAEQGTIHGLMVFKTPVSFTEFRANFIARYLSGSGDRSDDPFYRFQQRCVIRNWLWPYWQNMRCVLRICVYLPYLTVFSAFVGCNSFFLFLSTVMQPLPCTRSLC